MATDDRTPIQNFPRPHTANTVAEDFTRMITLVNMLEAKISAQDVLIAGKAASGHTHLISGVDGLQAALDAKQAADWRPALGDLSNVNVTGAASGQFLGLVGATWQPVTLSVTWGNISGKPSAFPTTWGDVTGKPATYPPSAHGHPVGEISGLQGALDAKLPLTGGAMFGDVAFAADVKIQFRSGNNSAAWGTGTWISKSPGTGETYFDNHDGHFIFRRAGWATTLSVRANGEIWAEGNVLGVYGNEPSIYLQRRLDGHSNTIWGKRANGTTVWNLELGNWSEDNFGIGRHDAAGNWIGNPLRIQQDGTTHIGTLGTHTFVNGVPYIVRQGGDEGGELQLQAPATNTSIANACVIDIWRNDLRFFEAGGSWRGAFLRISDLPAGISSALLHSNNFRNWLVAGDTQELGNYIFAFNAGANTNFGGRITGNFLYPSSHAAWQGAAVNGTWRAHGHGMNGHITLWQRIA